MFELPDGYHIATAIAVGYFGGKPDELPDDLEKTELKERDRNAQESFAWEGKWE